MPGGRAGNRQGVSAWAAHQSAEGQHSSANRIAGSGSLLPGARRAAFGVFPVDGAAPARADLAGAVRGLDRHRPHGAPAAVGLPVAAHRTNFASGTGGRDRDQPAGKCAGACDQRSEDGCRRQSVTPKGETGRRRFARPCSRKSEGSLDAAGREAGPPPVSEVESLAAVRAADTSPCRTTVFVLHCCWRHSDELRCVPCRAARCTRTNGLQRLPAPWREPLWLGAWLHATRCWHQRLDQTVSSRSNVSGHGQPPTLNSHSAQVKADLDVHRAGSETSRRYAQQRTCLADTN